MEKDKRQADSFDLPVPNPILCYDIAVKYRARGLSLLEIIFASFIFASLVTLLSGIWVLHARAQRQTGLMLVASDLADLEMNRALAAGYHDLKGSTGQYSQTWETNGQTIDHNFISEVEVFEIDEVDSNLQMKLVRVTVAYEEAGSQKGKKSLTLDSVIANEN